MNEHFYDRFLEAVERLGVRVAAEGRRELPLLSGRFTPQTLQTLIAVGRREGANLLELAAAMNLSSPSASILVRRLVQLGYVDRKIPTHNHRVITLYLTGSGKKILHQCQSFRRKLAEKILAPLSKQERNALIESLEKITLPHPNGSNS
jgi:DNA-binding MarR family transcriptional regulator